MQKLIWILKLSIVAKYYFVFINSESPTCDETRCLDNEQCQMISDVPMCTCLPGYETRDQICTPISQSK